MSNRIKILKQSDINDLYQMPILTNDQREWYFASDENVRKILSLRISIDAKVDSILQMGYFKAKKQFFNINYRSSYFKCEY